MNCSTCKYFSYCNYGKHTCRKRSPVVLQEGGPDEYFPVNCWPRVKPDDFCGEYEADEDRKMKIITGGVKG